MTMVECKTYRWYGHSRSDPRAYRTKAEEKAWHERDPITILRNRLTSDGLCTEQELDAIKNKAFATIEDATQFAMNSPLPNAADVEKDVYVDEIYPAQALEVERKMAAKVREATAVFEKVVATCGAKTKKEAAEIARAQIKSQFGMDIVNIAAAVAAAQAEEMRRDNRVFVFGEDVGLYGGAYQATRGLLEEFGKDRVIDTAISEAAIAGAAIGAALRGMRPVAEIMYVDFLTIAMDQLVHVGAYNRYMFGGKAKVPMVLRTEGGVGRCIAAHHSESLEAWVMHTPGLYVVMPSTPYDAKGLLKAAIRSENPVVFIEHKATYGQTGPVPLEDYIIPLGVADIKRSGNDATIVSYSRMAMRALEAAKILAAGANLITTAFAFHPARMVAADRDRLQLACTAGNSSLHGTGLNPGNLGVVVPIALSGMSRSIEHVRVQERADWSVYDSVEITFDQMRFGSPLDEVNADTDGLKFTSELFQQQVWLLADALGLGVDEVSTDLEVIPASVDRDVCGRTLAAGTVAGQHWRWTGRRAGRSVVEVETLWTVGEPQPPHWPSPQHGWTITIEGTPSMQAHLMTLASFRRDVPLAEHVRSASVATAMQAVNAVPAVCDAGPGFVTMADLPLRLFG